MVLHGLLHLLGSVNAWKPAVHTRYLDKSLIELTGNTSKFIGALWLLACLLFLTAAGLYLFRREWYWIPAALGILASQILIILYWQDAKYGTIVNAFILIVVIFSAAAMYFNKMANREIEAMMRQSVETGQTLTAEKIRALPQNVQRWLQRSGVVGKRNPNTLRVVQKGTMRTQPTGRWMPFKSIQHFSINPPAFVWTARIQAAPFIEIAGRDKYHQGHGNMLIKPLFLFTAANSTGKEIDQGTLLRYMAEMAWFPQSAVSEFVRWENIDDKKARVTMDYQGVSASGVFFFNDEGLVEGFEARRYGEFEGIYRKETWSVSVTGYKSFNGVTIGHKSEITWKLKEGDFKWLKIEITDVIPAFSRP